MARHVFGTALTSRAVAHNNRGENEGTVSTLQKIIRFGELYSTVSGEAIRYALREVWPQNDEFAVPAERLNRPVPSNGRGWRDPAFGEGWQEYVDNDVLGFMLETNNRRGALEVSRAVSTTPWPGTVTNHFASVGAQPSRTSRTGNANPIPYSVEIHDTRYQYTFAMTPDALQQDNLERTKQTLWALYNLRRVGGAHARFLYDFSPEMVVLRLTHDPAPRIMNCFVENEERGTISLMPLVHRMAGNESERPDVNPNEIIVGGIPSNYPVRDELQSFTSDGAGLTVLQSVRAAFLHLFTRLDGNATT
ncbi:MAG: type I-B CRISPR-associated protein Cas7/Cst2/DevR [Planctomycetaceae bacterium]|nr:type I-B CRISPR-associated protein Cas7/Cst2/DevR [Planctomycetaceae bacterium]